ncbi:hypothetical protein ABW45_16420 [Stenotrophomonas maltophilia]|nr:hypothetical protein ABW45_16420 [Stenotrophomonas maltophilia]
MAPTAAAPERAPDGFSECLRQIGNGAAADGQPWPERHLLPGRRLALADADGALAGQRVVLEVILAAERARQNGGPEQDLGDRVREGLALAALALTDRAISRLHPE